MRNFKVLMNLFWGEIGECICFLLLLYYYKSSILSYCSGGQKSKIDQQGCVPSAGSQGESIALPFPTFRSFLHFLAYSPSLHHQIPYPSI